MLVVRHFCPSDINGKGEVTCRMHDRSFNAPFRAFIQAEGVLKNKLYVRICLRGVYQFVSFGSGEEKDSVCVHSSSSSTSREPTQTFSIEERSFLSERKVREEF